MAGRALERLKNFNSLPFSLVIERLKRDVTLTKLSYERKTPPSSASIALNITCSVRRSPLAPSELMSDAQRLSAESASPLC